MANKFIRKNRIKRRYIRRKSVTNTVAKKIEKKSAKSAVNNHFVISHPNTLSIFKKLSKSSVISTGKNFIIKLSFLLIVIGGIIAIYYLSTLFLLLLSEFASQIPQTQIPQFDIGELLSSLATIFNNIITTITDFFLYILMSIAWIVSTVWDLLIKGEVYLFKVIVQLFSVVYWMLTQFISAIITFLGVMYVLFIQLLTFIWYVVSTTVSTIVDVTMLLWQWIVVLSDRFWYWISTPFRTLSAFFVQMKPFIDILGARIRDAVEILQNGIKTLTTIGSM